MRIGMMRTIVASVALTVGGCVLATLPACVVVLGNTSTNYSDGSEYSSDYPKLQIGVYTETVSPALAAQTGVDPAKSSMIKSTIAGWPAEQAGVKAYDILTSVDGCGSGKAEDLRAAIAKKKVGETVRLSLLRAGKPMEIDVAVAARDGVADR